METLGVFELYFLLSDDYLGKKTHKTGQLIVYFPIPFINTTSQCGARTAYCLTSIDLEIQHIDCAEVKH